MSTRSIAATFLSFVAIGLLWATAMPINAGPDEDQHMIWAASAARLRLAPHGEGAERALRAPAVLYVDHCLQFRPDVTADCQDHTQPNPAGDSRNIPVTRAAPYYVVIGIPSLVTSSHASAYLMRLGHILLTAGIFTLGVWNMAHRRPTPGSIALATVAFTPMVAFLIGTVNPSGPAIASGFAMWTGGLFMIRSQALSARRAVLFAFPIVVFLLVRQDALIWILFILAGLAAHAGGSWIVDLAKRPVFRVLLLVGAVGAVAWYMVGGDHLLGWAGRAFGSDQAGDASSSFGVLTWYGQQMIGQLGWLDVTLPQPVLFTWYGLIVMALLVCVGASRREGAIAVGVLVVVFGTAYLFDLLVRHRYYFQGRYSLPFLVGIPVMASAALTGPSRHLVPARMARAVVWMVATLSAVAFAVALRRYTVGSSGPWPDMFLDPAWSPPLPTWLLVGCYSCLMAALAIVMSRMIGRSDSAADAEMTSPTT